MPAASLQDHAPAPRRSRNRILAQWMAVALALVFLGGAIGVNLYLDYQRTATRERERLSTQARIIAENMELQLATANRVLESLLKDLSVWKGSYDRNTHVSFINAMANAMPGIRTIGILDADGILIASNNIGNLGNNLSHRNYFRTAKQHPNKLTLYVSAPFRSVLSASAINLTRAALASDGKFEGVVFATLNTQYFETLMRSVLYTDDMWTSLVHQSGKVFASMPNHENEPIDIRLSAFEASLVSHQHSGLSAPELTPADGLNGDTQMTAQRTVRPSALNMDQSLAVAVGRPLDHVFRSWRASAILQSGLFGLISLVTIFSLYAYQRKQRQFDRKEAQVITALSASEENYRLIVENTKDVVMKLNGDGLHTYINPAYRRLYGLEPDDVRTRYYWENVIPEDRSLVYEHFEKLFHPPYATSGRLREYTTDGVRSMDWTAEALRDAHGKITEIICIGRDVTEHIQHMSRLKEQAEQDFLTGLANRRHFMEMGATELARARRYKRPLSLVAFDVDHFKRINDNHGHPVGDVVLQTISRTVLEVLRDVDLVGRMGGEEFAILLPETGLEAAVEVAERVRIAISNAHVSPKPGTQLVYTISLGVTTLADHDDDLNVLLKRADTALYEAKHSGRNKVCTALSSL
ncbi:sensor domain-containing diguanylate cyclase [Candidimonas sp. SYP-B2681]|uniref:sensor domain-containing diguanylate cyclase n=1 Tax=Candidimonas sp. SYP-B2681 TaxID=2497686 RepID=UPI000F88A3B1|nr:diguanylate cyclase [Candidimonas sp. SYP-B2681]RTZ43368.1 sensor domain-containing diguanylate cyclase [Candidimonas sp. SYP-B2681]